MCRRLPAECNFREFPDCETPDFRYDPRQITPLVMDHTRYFKHEDCFWKFEPGPKPQLRTSHCRVWAESVFASIEAFLVDPAEATEVTALEAEEE